MTPARRMNHEILNLLFVFAGQGLDAFDHEDDGQDDQQNAKNGLCVRTPVSATL